MTAYVIREILSAHPSTSFDGEGVRLCFFDAVDDKTAQRRRVQLLQDRYPEHEFYKLVPVERD